MKKISILLAVSLLTPGLFAQKVPLSKQIERAVAQAVAGRDTYVSVQVKLAKPVYMSDVMFRRPRCKDMVIRVDYKQKSCTGQLSARQEYVSVPSSCVEDGKYRAAKVIVAFADGQKVTKSRKDIQTRKNSARIYL